MFSSLALPYCMNREEPYCINRDVLINDCKLKVDKRVHAGDRCKESGTGVGVGGCNHALGWVPVGGTTGTRWGTKTVVMFGGNHIHSPQAISLSIIDSYSIV